MSDDKKPKKNKEAGYGLSSMRKATKDERKAVRKTNARKEAKKGNLVGLYSEEKGGRLVTSKNSGATAARTNTTSLGGKKSTADAGSYGTSPGANKKASIADQENRSFYGDTKLGQRLVRKSEKNGNVGGVSGEFTKAELKPKRFGRKK